MSNTFKYIGWSENVTKTPFQAWVEKHFKKNSRPEIVIFQSENVLSPKSLKEVSFPKNFKTDTIKVCLYLYHKGGIKDSRNPFQYSFQTTMIWYDIAYIYDIWNIFKTIDYPEVSVFDIQLSEICF